MFVISKDDKSKFDISVVLEKIELTGPSNCLAHVKINGGDDALKFHKIPKSTFKYKGTYKIKYDDDYLALYDGGNIRLDLRFDEKKYLPKSKTEFKINLNKSILPSTKNYRNSIIVMFDDLAPESIYIDNSPKFESFRKEYKQAFEMEYQSDLNKLSLEKMKEKLNNFNKMKARQALRESEQLKYKNFQKEYYKQGFKACGVTCAILAIGLINSAVQGY